MSNEEAEQATEEEEAVKELFHRLEDAQSLVNQARTVKSAEALHDIVSTAEEGTVRNVLLDVLSERFAAPSVEIVGDHADFHNLATVAVMDNNYELSLEIVKRGLELCRLHPVLVGDGINALKGLGRFEDAVLDGLKYWRKIAPLTFASDWRPAVFVKDSIKEIDPSFSIAVPARFHRLLPDEMVKAGAIWGDVAEALLRTVMDHRPDHVKVWYESADVQRAQGRWEDAAATLQEGLRLNSGSQQLRYALGQLYLEHLGSVPADRLEEVLDEATGALEASLLVDYQEQFQSDVSQVAILLRLAQAYELRALLLKDGAAAVKAQGVYETLAEEERHFGNYASNRLRHLRTYIQVTSGLGDR